MADIRIAAILRAGIFSPNHIATDAAILHAVVAELRRRGCNVNVYTETEFCEAEIDEDIILTMSRTQKALQKIQLLEDKGCIVINSAYGIENCVRMIMVRLLSDAGVPMPESYVVDTDVDVRKKLANAGIEACWVKKADAPVHHLEDMARCRHAEEAQEILHEFFFRHISKAVVSRDIEGEKIRCYGIESSGWFHCFRPFRSPGMESTETPEAEVKKLCMRAAEILKVDIFGCDVIMTPGGDCYLVNFDDWPSFAPIRKEAAKEIAKSVMARIRRQSYKRKRP